MSILTKIYNHFVSGGTDLERRKIIKTAAGLVALTAISGFIPSILKLTEIKSQIKNGVVENQTFYLTEGIIIDIPNVKIKNCTFIATEKMPFMIKVTSTAKYSIIDSCKFHGNNLVDTCIYLEPRKDNISYNLQAAIDAAADNRLPIYIPSGKFHIGGKYNEV